MPMRMEWQHTPKHNGAKRLAPGKWVRDRDGRLQGRRVHLGHEHGELMRQVLSACYVACRHILGTIRVGGGGGDGGTPGLSRQGGVQCPFSVRRGGF